MCGNFGLLLLLPLERGDVLRLLKRMLKITMVRGAQSAQPMTNAIPKARGVCDGVVNGKRTDLARGALSSSGLRRTPRQMLRLLKRMLKIRALVTYDAKDGCDSEGTRRRVVNGKRTDLAELLLAKFSARTPRQQNFRALLNRAAFSRATPGLQLHPYVTSAAAILISGRRGAHSPHGD